MAASAYRKNAGAPPPSHMWLRILALMDTKQSATCRVIGAYCTKSDVPVLRPDSLEVFETRQ